MPLFKVWSLTNKKCVVAKSLLDLISSGKQKLGLKDEEVTVFLEDGTEVDEDEIFQELSPGTILYLLSESNQKPWEWKKIEVFGGNLEVPPGEAVGNDSFEAGTSSLESSFHGIQGQLLLPWPEHFGIPKCQFSADLNMELTSGKLSWRSKSELLGYLCREISKYTLKPTVAQRDEVARELVSLYPALKSNIGGGHHQWSQKIYDKMCEENKRRNSGVEKRPASRGGAKNVKLPRRGEINFAPSFDLNKDLSNTSKEILAEEALKPLESRNFTLIQQNMIITFSHRRELVSQKILMAELKIEYPILFSEYGLKTDFKLLNGFDLEPRFLLGLNKCSEKIKEEAISLKSKKVLVKEILDDNFPSDVTAVRLLPVLLADKDPSFLYKVYPYTTDPEMIKFSGPETPHVAVLESIGDNCLCYIVVEQDIICSVHGFIKAIMLTYAVYYCCNIKYPIEVDRTLKFVQTYILEMTESTKLPAKLLTFCSKMP